MDDAVDSVEAAPNHLGVAYVSYDELDLGTEPGRPGLVHLWVEGVQHPYRRPLLHEASDEVRTDEACAACNEDPHARHASSGSVAGLARRAGYPPVAD